MNMPNKQLTLVIVHKDGQVLLGMKKRGFGAGRWNGFGGKVEAGETIEEGARREMREEAGIEIGEMEQLGILYFEFEGDPQILEVHIFKTKLFTGIPIESEEMRPEWFSLDSIPFTEMWLDDVHWFPLFLAGKKFRGRFLFGKSGGKEIILEQKLNEVSGFA